MRVSTRRNADNLGRDSAGVHAPGAALPGLAAANYDGGPVANRTGATSTATPGALSIGAGAAVAASIGDVVVIIIIEAALKAELPAAIIRLTARRTFSRK